MARWSQNAPEFPSEPDDGEEGTGAPTLLEWARYALESARKRKLIVAGAFAASFGAFALFYLLRTPTYRVETRVLALDRMALPTAARSSYEETPGRSASDIVHRRENLLRLINQASLVPDPAGATSTSASAASEDRLTPLITALDKQIEVTSDRGTITITVDWADPKQAYLLTKAALDNFLEARYAQEVSAIEEVIAVLQRHSTALRHDLDAALENSHRRSSSMRRPGVLHRPEPSTELIRLQSDLTAKQRALQDVEEIRRRRVAELQSQLDQARNALSDVHPTVIALRNAIQAASRESPQVQILRDDEKEARSRYAERLAREGFGPDGAARPEAPIQASAPSTSIDSDVRIREAQAQYDQMAARLNTSRVELDAARAAFKYRYSVVWPPQLPEDPVSPNPRKIFGVGFLVSLFVTLIAAVLPDFVSGKIVHRFQVERVLKLPVLGEIDRES